MRYVDVSDEVARQAMLRQGIPPWITGMLVEYGQAYRAGWGDLVTDTFQAVTGRPPRSVVTFARDHAAMFEAHRDPQSAHA